MCTAATYLTKDFYFGRTLDYEFSYGEEIAVIHFISVTRKIWKNIMRSLAWRTWQEIISFIMMR